MSTELIDKKLLEQLKERIKKDLRISHISNTSSLEEAYVVTSAQHSLPTELLSSKTKGMLKERSEKLSEALNRVSAELDSADRETANSNYSRFADLKHNETRLINDNFLLGMHLSNISDVNSIIAMDSLTFLRIERDFGTFEAWQHDFIACALSASSGYAVTIYNTELKRYMNIIVDSDQLALPLASHPVVSLCVCSDAYVRDYLNDRKTYIFAMMKEFDWDVIEDRFKKAEKIAKAAR